MKATRIVFVLLACVAICVPMATSDLVSEAEQDHVTSAMHAAGDLTQPSQEQPDTAQPLSALFSKNESVPLLDMLVRIQVDTQSQHELHTTFGMLGEYTKTQFGLACNAFAGESACVSIDRGSSDIARFCNLEPTQIDCMFYSEDMVDMRETPVDRFLKMLIPGQRVALHSACPECLKNLQALWCAQAVPPCGTFDRLVNRALLPAVPELREMLSATAGQHVPHIPVDWSKGFHHNISRLLPCRSMCQAVVDTCTCGAQGSMGAALTGLTTGASGVGRDVLHQAIVSEESDVDLCNWFSADDYAGDCTPLPHTCTLHNQWCDKDTAANLETLNEAVMLGSIIKAVFGWAPPDVHGTRIHDEVARHQHHLLWRLLGLGLLAAAGYVVYKASWPYLKDAIPMLAHHHHKRGRVAPMSVDGFHDSHHDTVHYRPPAAQ